MKHYGFLKPDITPEDYVFGSNQLGFTELQPDGQWDEFLPIPELQNRNNLETYNCTAFGTLNAMEILMHRLFGSKFDFSERYVGILADTVIGGNNPHKVAETIRKQGVVKDELLPFSSEIGTWEEYYSPKPMTGDLLVEGQKFLNKYNFGHDWLWTGGTVKQKQKKLKEALKSSPICVSVNAWYKKQGKYYKPKGSEDNHWCTVYGYKDGEYWKVFDHYDDTAKRLEWDYDFGFAKRYTIELKPEDEKEQAYDFISRILELFKSIFANIKGPFIDQTKKNEIIDETNEKLEQLKVELIKDDTMRKLDTPRECLFKLAKENLGRDITPEDKIPDEVACAESVSALLKKIDPSFPIIPHTATMHKFMKSSSSFKNTLELAPGNIIISPTGYGNGTIRGHVGVILEGGKIASNNSNSGLWEDYFTITTWVKRYRGIGGFPVVVYELLDKNVKIGNMNTQPKFGAFKSSQDPEKLSLTIQSLIAALSSVAIVLFGDKIPLTNDQVTEAVGQIGIAVSAVCTVWGILRKGASPLGKAVENLKK